MTAARPESNDFPDWFSPIVVKELRQGLKSRSFVSIFVLIQAGMTLIFLLNVLSGDSGNGMGAIDGLFWMILWIPLILVLPLVAAQAVAVEKKQQTLELVQMTRMKSFRVMTGKWLALALQGGLWVVAILPFVVLRYFFGSVDLMQDLVVLSSLVLGCGVLVTLALMFSTMSIGQRVLIGVIGVFVLIASANSFIWWSVLGGSGTSLSVWPTSAWSLAASWLVMGGIAGVFFLLEGAAQLCTQDESYAGVKRWIGLLCLMLAVGSLMAQDQGWRQAPMLMPLLGITLWVMIEALCERVDAEAPLARCEAGALRFILAPGWDTGFWYAAVIGAIAVGGLNSVADTDKPGVSTVVIFFGALLLPSLVLWGFPRIKQRLLFYGLTQLGCGLIFAVSAALAHRPGSSLWTDRIVALTPTSALLAMASGEFERGVEPTIMPIAGGISALVILVMAGGSIRSLMRRFSRENA